MAVDEDPSDASGPAELSISLLFRRPFPSKSLRHYEPIQDAFKGQWALFYGSKVAMLANDLKSIEIKDVADEMAAPSHHIQLESIDITDEDREEMESDEETKEVSYTITAQDLVLAMAFSACGEFLAVADASGVICLYRVDGQKVFAYSVLEKGSPDRVASMKFVPVEGVNSACPQELLVVVSSGTMLRLHNLRLAEFEKLRVENPSDLDANMSKILVDIGVQKTDVGALNENAQSCLLVHHYESSNYLILGNHGTFFSVWKIPPSDQDGCPETKRLSICDSISEHAPVEAIAFDQSCGLLMVLSEGKLSWWNWRDAAKSSQVKISGVRNFTILDTSVSNPEGQSSASLVGIARSLNDEKRTVSLELVHVTHPNQPDAGSTCAISKTELVTNLQALSVRMNIGYPLSSVNGELQGIVACRTRRGISLLRLACMETLEILKADCFQRIENEKEESTQDEDPVKIAEALVNVPVSSLLDPEMMTKCQSVVDVCIASIGDNEEDSRILLKHLLQIAGNVGRFNASSSSSLPTSAMCWCGEINELSYRWTTFQLLRSSSTSAAGAVGKTLKEKWRAFQVKPILEMLEDYMKRGAMRAIATLWGRHVNDEIVCNICKLLQDLPASLPVSVYADWIQNEVIPALIQRVEQPSTQTISKTEPDADRSLLIDLVLWLLERSEAAASKGDMDAAIRLCNLLKNDESGVAGAGFSFYEFKLQTTAHYSGPQVNNEGNVETPQQLDAFARIALLRQTLRHIKHLAVEHQFSISLRVFKDETPATIAMSMLDRVSAPELLKKEVEAHVSKYLKFCNIPIDPVIHDYVKELADSNQVPQSPEEARALELLDEISDVELRADATLALLQSALPPYSQKLKSYANERARTWNTGRLEEIQEHVRLMEIQDMLMTYGITQFDIADAKSASRLLAHILSQISQPTAFADAMCLVDAYTDLRCDRAAVQFTENLLSFSYGTGPETGAPNYFPEITSRTSLAIEALGEVKRRQEPESHLMMYVSLIEEITEFGVALLEMESEVMEATINDRHSKSAESQSGSKSHSFVLRMLEALVAAYLRELRTLQELAIAVQNDAVIVYTENPAYLLSDALLTDLQRMCRVEEDYEVLLSVSMIRDLERCEMKLKQLMKPEILFGNDPCDGDELLQSAPSVVPKNSTKGKGKKRAAGWGTDKPTGCPSKRQCVSSGNVRRPSPENDHGGLQQNDARARLIFDLNRFASAVGIESRTCQSLIAQNAARSGSILQAVRFSRDLFSRRSGTGIRRTDSSTALAQTPNQDVYQTNTRKFNYAETLKSIAMSLSFYTATHAKEIYDSPRAYGQRLTPTQAARLHAPMYSLELLKYSICVCDVESFDEALVLLKNAVLVNDVLEFTQFDFSRKETIQGLYPRWFRGDACVLPSYQAMKFATRFAIAEHKNLGRESDDDDTIASKRYVSFLVDQQADLLGLQMLLTMRTLPNDAVGVVQTQLGKLLSTVFQSQELDNYLALGLMLSMEQVNAFHAFREQISRENVTKDFNRFRQLAFIGADAARAWEQIAFLHQCVELEGNARWWHYLSLLGIECNHKAFQSERRDLEYICRLVPTLITRSNYDFYTVLEFTRHYQIDDGFPSIVYVESLLLQESAKNDLEYQNKIAGVIEDIHEQHLVKLLLKSIPKVSGVDYDRLLFIFQLLLDNTFYPEREEVERRVDILHTLKAFVAFQAKEKAQVSGSLYKESVLRVGAASCGPDTNSKDTVDETKISFHDLMAKPRKVLAQHLTKDNLNALIGLAEPLRLEQDELQMLLLKNLVSAQLKQNASVHEEGSAILARFSAFENILKCLSDTESRVTASEWLAENFPLGEEKVKALEFALSAAVSGKVEREDSCNTSFAGQEALARLETKLLRLKVQMLLQNASSHTLSFVENIDDKQTDKLLGLVSEPKELFLELYRRYALRFYTQGIETLHLVANSIAELLHLPQTQLRLELVREWLVKDAVHMRNNSSNEEGKEDSFTVLDDEKLHQIDEDFVKRILYVASASVKQGNASGEEMLTYLISFAKELRPRSGVTFRAKMRALRVILRLGQLHHAVAEQYAASKYGAENSDVLFKELLNFTRHCAHMVAFEEHRAPYHIALVLKSDKEALTRNLLRRFPPHQPWVLRCASELMLDFGVEAPDLWEVVLSNMKELKMVRSLTNVLGPLSRKTFIRSLECGQQLWEDVLMLPMIQLKHNLSSSPVSGVSTQETDGTSTKVLCFAGIPVSDVSSALERMVDLLQRCPFLDQIDVPAFVIHLRDLTEMAEAAPDGEAIVQQLDLYGFAVKCALTIPKPSTRFEALVRIIQAGAYRPVLHALSDTLCLLNDEQNDITMELETGEHADNFRLVQEIFSEAQKRGDYAGILGTPFEQGFVEYLAASSNIDHLLSLLLEENRMETALAAVELYYEYHPAVATSFDPSKIDSATETSNSSADRWGLVQTYLASSTSEYLKRFRHT